MKKLLFLAIVLTSCGNHRMSDNDPIIQSNGAFPDFTIKVIDSCEYIVFENAGRMSNAYSFSMTHKGNCKYCLTRNTK